MIDQMATNMARRIKAANPERTASVEVMRFSLILLLNFIATVILCLAIGLFTGKLYETVVTLAGFVALRFFSGGFHLKSSDACVLFSTGLISILPHLPSSAWTLWLNAASLVLVALLAPAKIEMQVNVSQKHRPWFKLVSVLIVSSNLLIGSDLLAKAFFAQSILLLPFPNRRR